MKQRNYLTKWERAGDRIKLDFLDGTILYISKADFDRAFGCIINLTKDEVEENFAIQGTAVRVITAQMLMQYLAYQATIRCTNTTTPVNDVTFTVSEIQKAFEEIQTASQSYLQYRADINDKAGGLPELFK